MKHENNSLNEPFYHLYLLLHIINIILHTLPPMKEKFLKDVMKELHISFFIQVLTALSTSSMESHT
jgi:hypothetical protein